MTLTLEAALERVPQWQGADPQVTFLAGGQTNKNYRVDVGGASSVLRLSGANTELLGINRDTEHAANQAAAALGLAPEVIHFIQPEGCLVTRFITGRHIPPDEMRQPDTIRVVAGLLQRLHALPPIPGEFSPFRVVESYYALAQRYGVTSFPENFAELLAHMQSIERAFLNEPFTPRPCHNDLLNENFLLEAATGRIYIIDWEYAGMGDPHFDLANLAAHHGFDDEHDRCLLEAYFGAATPRRLARHKLMRCLSDFREAMWGMLQIGISTLDIDYRRYAGTYFDRLLAGLNDPRRPAWLAALA